MQNLVIHVRSELVAFLVELIQRKPEKDSAEDELNYVRTASQALRCLSKYYHLSAVQSGGVQSKLFDLNSLLEGKAFWKLQRSKHAQVRAGFYNLGNVTS